MKYRRHAYNRDRPEHRA